MMTEQELVSGLRDGFAAQEQYVDQARVDAVWTRARAQAGAGRGRRGTIRPMPRRWPVPVGIVAAAAIVLAVIVFSPRQEAHLAAPSDRPTASAAATVPGALPAAEAARLPACRAGDIAFVQMVGGSEHGGPQPPQGILDATFRATRACRLESMPLLTAADGTRIPIERGRLDDARTSVGLPLRSKPYYRFQWDFSGSTNWLDRHRQPDPTGTIRLAGAKGRVVLIGWRPGTVLRLAEQRVDAAERTLPAMNPGDVLHETLKGSYGVNRDGVTFGSDAVPTADGKQVQLVLVIATNRRQGYAWREELAGPQPKDPAQALEWQRTKPKTRTVPVYDSSGKRQIGVFQIGGRVFW